VSLHSVVAYIVERDVGGDPVSVAADTLGATVIDGEPISVKLRRLNRGERWPLGRTMELAHPSFPPTRMRHKVYYAAPRGNVPPVFHLHIRFDLGGEGVHPAAADAAVTIARSWIQQRSPSWVFVCGSGAGPSDAALADPGTVRELAWWTWSPLLEGDLPGPAFCSERIGSGTSLQLIRELDSAYALPAGLGAALGLPKEPRLFTGLQVTEDAGA
jgi:hypothetical protein